MSQALAAVSYSAALSLPPLLTRVRTPVQSHALRDVAAAIAERANGATTVSATMLIAHAAGIRVFVTGESFLRAVLLATGSVCVFVCALLADARAPLLCNNVHWLAANDIRGDRRRPSRI